MKVKINEDTQLRDLKIKVPDWIEQDITVGAVEGIRYGGCSSGAYMPAVTYSDALKTMSEHGDDILEYLDGYIELDADFLGLSWSGMACYLVSCAVESWADAIEGDLVEKKREHNVD